MNPRADLDADLDALESRHAEEEQAEAERVLSRVTRPMRVRRPPGGRLPASEAWLERLYAGDRVVREKKPGVFDHLCSVGPWFVSVDEEPLSVLDGMSQTATVCEGFAEDAVVRAYVEGEFADTLTTAGDTSGGDHPAARAYAAKLRELVPGLPHVSFVNSGAEACEKALALCRLEAGSDRRRRVLAFEGSFHGRTLLALHASYNPKKRAPFEIAGHEVSYASFPVWEAPHDPEPAAPEGYLELVSEGALDQARDRWGEADPLLASEVTSLAEVHRHLSAGDHFAVLVEPMLIEGGDGNATGRFFRALRLLTRHHGLPLVFDEVQTGFGLGGSFVWHARFGLIDRDGAPDGPDYVTFAKRAQAGVVMGRSPDPEPTSGHPASLVRGLVHARMMENDTRAAWVEGEARRRLEELARRFPGLIRQPRATGYALAFDVPSPEHQAAYLAQRFWRGAITFGAGTRTVRYRLSRAFDAHTLDRLFGAIRESLEWLEAHPGEKPPAWHDAEPSGGDAWKPRALTDVRVRDVSAEEAHIAIAHVLALEVDVYEPARRDPPERLRLGFDDPDGVAIIAEARTGDDWRIVGYCLGAPLERLAEVPGPDRDPMLGRHDTLYSIALTVHADYQGLGLGRRLKQKQLEVARGRCRADGSPRYRHVSGRNRVGLADNMIRLNRAFGAYGLYRIAGVYDDPDVETWYYRLPLGAFLEEGAPDGGRSSTEPVDLAAGPARPFHEPPAGLRGARAAGLLFGPAANKVTVCNYVTPAIVRGIEWTASLAPALPHLYLASSRDETFDKAVRALRCFRKAGQVVLGLEGGYVGHTTGAARSLSDSGVHRQGPGYFDGWRRLPHPADAGVDATLEALRSAVDQVGGPDQVLGLFLEPVQERTGRVVPEELWPRLSRMRDELGIPVVLVETATAGYRSGRGPFHAAGTDFTPDVLTWWGGGQIGFVHVRDEFFVDTPLTLVSTWDGDELSLIRVHHQLRAARRLDVASRAHKLEGALAPAREAGMSVRGAGLYRVLDAGGRAEAVVRGLAARGWKTRPFPNGHVPLAPPLDLQDGQLEQLGDALREACR